MTMPIKNKIKLIKNTALPPKFIIATLKTQCNKIPNIKPMPKYLFFPVTSFNAQKKPIIPALKHEVD